jgi:hypothetical protein
MRIPQEMRRLYSPPAEGVKAQAGIDALRRDAMMLVVARGSNRM